MREITVWNGFTQDKLDAAYNNMAAVSDSVERLGDWAKRSEALRARQPAECNIAYRPSGETGDRTAVRTCFDLFRSGREHAPLMVFIHGGWWQRNSRSVFSCMAEGPMSLGFDVAVMGYTLAPDADLSQIEDDIRTGLDHLAARERRRQQNTGKLRRCILSGWSAGAHLTALVLDHPFVCAGVCISGVYDLEPIRHSYINDALGLSDHDVEAHSPCKRALVRKPVLFVWGGEELPELRRQSHDFAVLRFPLELDPEPLLIGGENHFSVLEHLAKAQGRITRAISSLSRQLDDAAQN